jgi:predicted transcriptional regulator
MTTTTARTITPDHLAVLAAYCADYTDTPRKQATMLARLLKKNNLTRPRPHRISRPHPIIDAQAEAHAEAIKSEIERCGYSEY